MATEGDNHVVLNCPALNFGRGGNLRFQALVIKAVLKIVRCGALSLAYETLFLELEEYVEVKTRARKRRERGRMQDRKPLKPFKRLQRLRLEGGLKGLKGLKAF